MKSQVLHTLQRQLTTPIRNACFSYEFADMLHWLQVLNRFQSLAALQVSQKILRNGALRPVYTCDFPCDFDAILVRFRVQNLPQPTPRGFVVA